MKKVVQLLVLTAAVAIASKSTAGALPTCNFPYPCSFTEDDCSTTYSQEYTYDCLNSSNQIWHIYQWSCSGRPPHGGECYVE